MWERLFLTFSFGVGVGERGREVCGFILYRVFKKDPDEGTPATDTLGDSAAYLNKVKELQKLINVSGRRN